MLDYGLCFVGDGTIINVFEIDSETQERRLLKTDPVKDGFAVFKLIKEGDLNSYALYDVTNASDAWLRSYQVELK